MQTLFLLAMPALSSAYLSFYPSSFYWQDVYTFGQQLREPTAPSPYSWSSTPDAYTLKMRLPELEPDSISASLASDSATLHISGKRKFEGCTCQPTTVREVPLPYRPRAEDISIALDKNDVLSLALARSAKADAPTPIKVSVAQEEAGALKSEKEPSSGETRPLRFIPHPSASTDGGEHDEPKVDGAASSLAAQEKSLTERFRAAAAASLAVQSDASTEGTQASTVKTEVVEPSASADAKSSSPAAAPAA